MSDIVEKKRQIARSFKKSKCALVTGLVLSGGLSLSTLAEDESPANLTGAQGNEPEAVAFEEVIVTGMRQSLEAAIGVKRNDARIVDAVVAEDIGKLPDTNVADALGRITGVSISRSFGVGNGVSIRGLTQNRVEVNGRTTLGGGRDGISFQDVPPELLSSIEVVKSPTPKMIEGALGGTINLRTRRPLDLKDPLLAGTLQGEYANNADEYGYQASGQFAKNWDDGSGGRFGVLGSVAYFDQTLQTNQFSNSLGLQTIDGFANTVVPFSFAPRVTFREDERIAINSAIQWEPKSADGHIYLEVTYTDNDRVSGDASLFANGNTVVDSQPRTTITAEGQFLDDFTFRSSNFVPSFDSNNRLSETISAAVGTEWNLGNFDLSSELSYASSEEFTPFRSIRIRANDPIAEAANPTDNNFLNFDANLDFNGGQLQSYTVLPGVDFTDPNNFALFRYNDQETFADNTELAFRADASYSLDDKVFGLISSADFGFRVTNRTFETRRNNTAGGNLDTTLTRNGAPVIVRATELLNLLEVPVDLGGDFLDNVDFDFNGQRQFVGFNRNTLANDWESVRAALTSLLADTSRPYGGPAEQLGAFQDLEEDTWATYFQVNLDGSLGSVPFSGVVGVRYVDTSVTATGFVNNGLTGVDERATDDGDYGEWLPSVNLNFSLQEDVLLRLAYGKVMRRPGFAQLRAGLSTSPDLTNNFIGNPGLEPFRSTQYDASLEWYFDNGSLLSFAVFYKDIESFLRDGQVCLDRPDLVAQVVDAQIINQCRLDGSLGEIFADTPRPELGLVARTIENGEAGSVSGFELGLQHNFDRLPAPFDGLGIVANYTYSDSEDPNGEPLAGISENSGNLIGLYEKGPIGLRLALSYRDAFKNTDFDGRLRQIGSDIGNPDDPTLGNSFQDDQFLLDLGVSYEINDQFTVTFDAVNLTEEEQVFQSSGGADWRFTSTDRRFLFGVRASF